MEQDPNSYQFMNETIKNLPPDRKKIAGFACLFVGAAVVFGLIAAFVFAVVEPKIRDALYPEEIAQVTIPEDEEPVIETDSTEITSVSSSLEEEEPPAQPEEKEPQSITMIQQMTLADYQKLRSEIVEIARGTERALVRVIGIQNQMDYFNRTYENQQEICGLIIADNGSELFVLTEYRVVAKVERIQVTFWNDEIVDATFQRWDPNTGLAILKVNKQLISKETADSVMLAPLGNSYYLSQGGIVMAIGSPNGYSNAVVVGNITSVGNDIHLYDTTYNLINTDILGSKEGSGALLNSNGEVVGVIQQQFSPSGETTATAIGISQVKTLIQNLSNNISQPFLGILGQDVTSEVSRQTGIPIGVLVSELAEESPAMLAGVKEADVIVKIGDEKISSMKEYKNTLMKLKEGDSVSIVAMRKGAEGYVEVTFDEVVIGAMPEHE